MLKKILLINTHPGKNKEYVDKLKKLLEMIKGSKIKVINGWANIDVLKYNPSHIILSAVQTTNYYSLTEKENQKLIKKHFSWIKKVKCPILGICYGHQIISYIFGGKIKKLRSVRYHEKYKLNIPYNETIFQDITTIQVNVTHRDFVKKVPKGFRIITKKHGVPYIIYNPRRKIYGFQFHPYYNDFITIELLRRFLEL